LIFLHEQLVDASPLKNEIANSVDIMVVRELIGGWTFFTFNKDLNVYHDSHSQACLYANFGIDQIHFISYCFVNLACVYRISWFCTKSKIFMIFLFMLDSKNLLTRV